MNKKSNNQNQSKHTESSNKSDIKLLFDPRSKTIDASNSALLDVVIDSPTGKNQNTLVQLEIAFDPLAVTSIKALVGRDLLDYKAALMNIDYETGRLSYALRGTLSKNGPNIVAQIPIQTNTYHSEQYLEIKFMPKTAVTINGEMQNIYKLDQTTILFPTPTPYYYSPPSN